MTNNQLIIKLKKDMQMRNFSHYTYDTYLSKTKDGIEIVKARRVMERIKQMTDDIQLISKNLRNK